jgi:hypothetical protein
MLFFFALSFAFNSFSAFPPNASSISVIGVMPEEIHAACDRPGSTRHTLRVLRVVCDEAISTGLITVSENESQHSARRTSATISSGAPGDIPGSNSGSTSQSSAPTSDPTFYDGDL